MKNNLIWARAKRNFQLLLRDYLKNFKDTAVKWKLCNVFGKK